MENEILIDGKEHIGNLNTVEFHSGQYIYIVKFGSDNEQLLVSRRKRKDKSNGAPYLKIVPVTAFSIIVS